MKIKLLYLVLMLILLVSCEESLESRVSKDVKRGNLALEMHDLNRAVNFFNDALDQKPNEIQARRGLTLAWMAFAQSEESDSPAFLDNAKRELLAWKRAVELEGGEFGLRADEILWNNTIQIRFASSAFLQGNTTQTLSLLKQVLWAEKDTVNYLQYLQLSSFVSFSQSRDSIAIEYGRQLIEAYPSFEQGYLDVGKMYWQTGDYDEALVVWSVGQENFPLNEELSYWALEAMDKTGWLND
jgi:tetratricopeptide (TPR) repeat protein